MAAKKKSDSSDVSITPKPRGKTPRKPRRTARRSAALHTETALVRIDIANFVALARAGSSVSKLAKEIARALPGVVERAVEQPAKTGPTAATLDSGDCSVFEIEIRDCEDPQPALCQWKHWQCPGGSTYWTKQPLV